MGWILSIKHTNEMHGLGAPTLTLPTSILVGSLIFTFPATSTSYLPSVTTLNVEPLNKIYLLEGILHHDSSDFNDGECFSRYN